MHALSPQNEALQVDLPHDALLRALDSLPAGMFPWTLTQQSLGLIFFTSWIPDQKRLKRENGFTFPQPPSYMRNGVANQVAPHDSEEGAASATAIGNRLWRQWTLLEEATCTRSGWKNHGRTWSSARVQV